MPSQRQTISSSPILSTRWWGRGRPLPARHENPPAAREAGRAGLHERVAGRPRSARTAKRRALALQLGHVGATDPAAVAGEIDVRMRRPALGRAPGGCIAASPDRTRSGTRRDRRLAPRCAGRTSPDRVASDAMRRPADPPSQASTWPSPSTATARTPERTGIPRKHPRQGIPDPLGQGRRQGREARGRLHLRPERVTVEHGHDRRPRLGVLMRDERQQRPGSDEGDAPADRHALRLEGDLRRPEGEHPRQGPARKGRVRSMAPVASTSRSTAIRSCPAARGSRDRIRSIPAAIPHTIVRDDNRSAAPARRRGRAGPAPGRPRSRRVRRPAARRRAAAAIDLAAGAVPLVEEERAQPCLGETLRRPQTRRAGPDDRHDGSVKTGSGTDTSRDHRHAGSTSVVQARTRRPSAKVTQQSWQAPSGSSRPLAGPELEPAQGAPMRSRIAPINRSPARASAVRRRW